uniref:Uncharacterized protein n=1 Tax=Anopheles stephensi TaxID=30069 RepID=A0A182YS92_ANOST
CKPTAYHYKGRCYIQCPPGTYPSAPLATEANSTAGPAHRQADIDEMATHFGQRPLPPSSLRRRREQHVVRDDEAAGLMSNGPTIRQPNAATSSAQPPQCLQCHTTCLKCVGPKATDCTECQAAFRFQPIASGGESRICVSINDKQRPQQQFTSTNNNGSGRLKTVESSTDPSIASGQDTTAVPPHSYLPSVLFLAGVLVVAVVAIYVLWLHCFQGTPGGIIGDLTGVTGGGGDGGDGGGGGAGGGSAGLASIRYDRVRTNEQDDPYEDDESASSGDEDDDDGGDLLSVSATKIMAPIER